MKKWLYKHRGYLQLVAYIVVIVAAVYSVVQVQNVAHDNAAAIRQSQYEGCMRANRKTELENVKFQTIYDIFTEAIDKPKHPLTSAERHQLIRLRRDFRPISPVNCRKQYPNLK